MNKIEYRNIVNKSLYNLFKEILEYISCNKDSDEYHLYVTFSTKHHSVKLPDNLLKEYPENMTIVMQHMFENLIIKNDSFSVILSFNGKPHEIYIGFDSIVAINDKEMQLYIARPAVNTQTKKYNSEGNNNIIDLNFNKK